MNTSVCKIISVDDANGVCTVDPGNGDQLSEVRFYGGAPTVGDFTLLFHFGTVLAVLGTGAAPVVSSTVISVVHHTTGDITIPTSTDTLIPFSTVYLDDPTNLPYSGGIWTIKSAGVYQIEGSLFYQKLSSGAPTVYASLFLNNALAGQVINLLPAANYFTLPFQWVKRLAVNDQIKIIGRQTTHNGTVMPNSIGFQTSCSVAKLGN